MTTILQNGFTKLVLPSRNGFHFIDLKKIMFLKAHGNYTLFYLDNEKSLIATKTIGLYQKILENHFFFRLSRSHIINLRHLEEYQHFKSPIVKLKNGKELTLAESRKALFKKMIINGISVEPMTNS